VAQGTVLVSAISSHQVVAKSAATGKTKWTFAAGARVDSPPTIYHDLVLFGSSDGNVYCLRLQDGERVWQFRAAPLDVRTVALEQVESLWPVHGSVLVTDDTAYFTAGRSSHIDGGLFLYALDPRTGSVKYRERLYSPPATPLSNPAGIAQDKFSQNIVDHKTQLSGDRSDAFSMAGNLSDILVADDEAIYLRHMKLNKQLKPLGEWTHHLFSTSTLLDSTESYRAHWFYGNGDFSRLPVAYEWLTRGSYGGFATPLGRFLVFDEDTLWGAGWKNLALYRTDIRNIDGKLAKDFPKNERTIAHHPLSDALPIHTRAMIKAGDLLYLAGYPTPSSVRHFQGEPITDRGMLLHVDAASGQILKQVELPASPVFDGMSAAKGRMYLALENGSLMCLQ
jgi:hypothetical protein